MINKLFPFFFCLISGIIFSQNPVTFQTEVNKISENKFELITNAYIEKGWRLYSQNLQKGGAIPTAFIYEKISSIELIDKTIESESITKFDPIFNIDQTYFEDEATFVQKVETNNIISTYNVKVEYQACDDVVCIFREADLVFKFDGSKLKIQNQDLTSFIIEENNPLLLNLKDKQLLESINDSSDSFSSNSYLNLLILGFIGGLLALLTPCVFPMIPLTVSFFTNNESKSNSKFNAFVYGFFIIGIYLALSIPFHFLDSLDPEILNSVSTNAYLNVLFL